MFRPKPIPDSSRPETKRSQQGFSLIEIAVVLMILAIVTAFVVPQIVSYMRMYRLGVGGPDLAKALQRARYLATSNNTLPGVAFNEPQHVDGEQYAPAGKLPAQNRDATHLPGRV